jgi:hypothetical protein
MEWRHIVVGLGVASVRKVLIIISICAGVVMILVGGLLVQRIYDQRRVVLKAAEEVSAKLNSAEQIEKASFDSQLLSPSEVAAIPGLSSIIAQDLGDLSTLPGSFYRLPDAFINDFHFSNLPGNKLYRGEFIMHVPTGMVYYAGYPVSMKSVAAQQLTNLIQANDDGRINPLKGWAPPADSLPQPNIQYTMAYAGIFWSDLEPQKGSFDFASVEAANNFEYCRQNHIRLILRVIMDYPNKQNRSQLPDWLYGEMGGDGVWYAYKGEHMGFSPNYENPILIAAHERLIAELGRRYNQDSLIAFIQIGSLGHYGEWHVDESAGRMPSPKVTDLYVDHYKTAFPDKVFMFRRPVSQMLDLRSGLFNDMIGDTSQTNRWLNWIATGGDSEFPDMAANPDFWKSGPSGGEFANGNPYLYLTDETYNETVRQISASHTSLIGPNVPTDFSSANLENHAWDLLNRLGYRFRFVSAALPRFAKPGSTFGISLDGENIGNSPFYYPWPVKIQLFDQSGELKCVWPVDPDIRKWLPGSFNLSPQLRLPDDLEAGIYNLSIAILDPWTSAPGIEFANEGRNASGSYTFGNLLVIAN